MKTPRHVSALGLALALASAGPTWANTTGAALLSPAMVFATWDADNDKKLTPAEFNAGWARMERAATVRQLKTQFDRQDANRNGAIDPAEYATLELIRKSGASAPPIGRFDGDKSGGLDFKEYVATVTALVAKSTPAPATSKAAAAPAK